MIGILLVLCAGTLTGWIVSGKSRIQHVNNHLLNWVIYLMLLLLGISVGTNAEVMQNLGKIGYDALIIAFFSIAGSVILSGILYRLLFSKMKDSPLPAGGSRRGMIFGRFNRPIKKDKREK